MFSELPSIFDRNFVISFFLPAFIFVAAGLGLCYAFGLPLQIPSGSSLETTTVLVAASLLGGVILLVLNYEIYRILEGYPVLSLELFRAAELRRFRRIRKELEALHEERKQYPTGVEMPKKITNKRPSLWIESLQRFPDREDLVLPTSFGNTIRAFEVYSRVIYGFDAIPGWERLQAVIPKDYQGIVNEAKAITDFWVNTLVVSFLFALGYVGLVIYAGQVIKVWVPTLAIGVGFISYSRAKGAAKGWGETVKAAFDVFLPDLRKKLQFPLPANINAERELWVKFSRVMIFERTDLELNREESKNSSSQVV